MLHVPHSLVVYWDENFDSGEISILKYTIMQQHKQHSYSRDNLAKMNDTKKALKNIPVHVYVIC